MKSLHLFLLIFFSFHANAQTPDWKCRFFSGDNRLAIQQDKNNVIYKINKQSFSLTEYFESMGNSKGIEYSLTCFFRDQSCQGFKKINILGMQRLTKFNFFTNTKGSELREFNSIRYFVKMRGNYITLIATHKNKLQLECEL